MVTGSVLNFGPAGFFIQPNILLFSSPDIHLSPCALEQAEISWFLHSYTNHACLHALSEHNRPIQAF